MAPKYPGPPEALELYEQLTGAAGVDRKGAKNPYTSRNGHMFSFLGETGSLALRLPKESLTTFLEDFDTELAVSYNTVMKEYAVVPDAMLADTDQILPWFEKSHEWIGTLKPKPTKKPKKK